MSSKGRQAPSPAAEPSPAGEDTDGILAEWGARLYYPIPRGRAEPGQGSLPALAVMAAQAARPSASDIRARIRETVSPRARQVMVKITGGGKGMKPIAAHFRYISRLGKEEVGGKGKSLELEDETGRKISGATEIKEVMEQWRTSGAYLEEESHRREAFNIILSMPAGTPGQLVRDAAAETARELFRGHQYVFVLHEDAGAPHVHLVVKADSHEGVRLSPRKADLDRWRATFARALQARGVNAVATRQALRGVNRAYAPLWERHAKARGSLRRTRSPTKSSAKAVAARAQAMTAWKHLANALAHSKNPDDVKLAADAVNYLAAHAAGGAEAARTAAQEAQNLEKVKQRAPGLGAGLGKASDRSRRR